ncbi:MAG: hydrogenase maturation factor [Lachnospiraceae bacterium]|nr:hydrogenase maturation factor [Lachnospiraceae bacterium]
MKVGKAEEKVYKRSIEIYLPTANERLAKKPSTGRDASAIKSDFFGGGNILSASSTFIGKGEQTAKWALAGAVNNILASGGEPIGVSLMITMPKKLREIKLKGIMSAFGEECEKLNLAIIGGHTQVSEAVNEPVISVNAIGREIYSQKEIKPGMDIVMSGYAGAAGTAIIAAQHESKLKERFPEKFVESAMTLEKYKYVKAAVAVAGKSDAYPMHDGGQGGIFGALWEMATGSCVGLEIEMRKILFRQETIEISEFFDINPYELFSQGVILFACENGVALKDELLAAGIEAEVIGRTTASNDRVIINGEERRFLEPAKSDQLFVLEGTTNSD